MKHLHLTGGWNTKHYEISFEEIGKRKIRINVHKGCVRIGHHVFNVHNGAWSNHPIGKPSHYILYEGEEHCLEFDLHCCCKRPDKVFLSNEQFFSSSKVSYEEVVEKNNQ